MHQAPHEPGEKPLEFHFAQIGHGGAAAHGGQLAPVAVLERRLHPFAPDPSGERLGDVFPLLLGDRGEAGQGRFGGVFDAGGVADDVDPVVVGERQLRGHAHAALFVPLHAQPLGHRRGLDAGGPDDGAGLQGLAAAGDDAFVLDVLHLAVDPHLDAQAMEGAAGGGPQLARHPGQRFRRRFQKHDPRRGGPDGGEIAAQGEPGQLGQRPRHLHPRGTRADEHERHQFPPGFQVGAHLRLFECQQHPAADLQRIVQVLEAQGVLLPGLLAEEEIPHARGEHQGIVGPPPVAGDHLPAGAVHAGDLVQHHRHVLPAANEAADGDGDVLGRQPGAGHLVEQGLEQVMVAFVDHLQADRLVPQVAEEGGSAEPGADHHHAGPGGGVSGIRLFLRSENPHPSAP